MQGTPLISVAMMEPETAGHVDVDTLLKPYQHVTDGEIG